MGKEAEIIVHPGTDHAFFNDDAARGPQRRGVGLALGLGPSPSSVATSPSGRPARAARAHGVRHLTGGRGFDGLCYDRGHVRTIPRPAPPFVHVDPRLEREVPGQGADGGGRHDLPRPRGLGGPAREGGGPGQGGRRHQEPGLGRPGAVRAGQRLGHRVDLRRRHRGGRATPGSASTRSCCPRSSRRPRSSPSTSCSPRWRRTRGLPSATSGSRPRSRRPGASSTSRRSAPPRPGSRPSSSVRPTSPPPWRCRCSPAGSPIPEYPGDHFNYVFSKILMAGRANGLQVIDGPFLKVRDLDAPARVLPAHPGARLRRQVGAHPRPGRRC